MTEVEFKNRKLNIDKLCAFGFTKQNETYMYACDLAQGQLRLSVVLQNGKIHTQVIDKTSGDEYILHLVPAASGSFVGQVKCEYEAVLDEICSKCFDIDIFKSSQAKSIIAYVRDTYGDELEFLWQKFPDNAIWRRKDNEKWYAALLTVSRRKLGFDSDEMIEILDLRTKPEDLEALIDGVKYFPGYHMNKKHWFTICLDNTVDNEEIFKRIQSSYEIAGKK